MLPPSTLLNLHSGEVPNPLALLSNSSSLAGLSEKNSLGCSSGNSSITTPTQFRDGESLLPPSAFLNLHIGEVPNPLALLSSSSSPAGNFSLSLFEKNSLCFNDQNSKPVRLVHYEQPVSRLAINVTLLHRFSKTAESIQVLKDLYHKFKDTGVYFFNSNVRENEKFNVVEITSLLKEFGITEGRILNTYGLDAEAMNKERITHIIDNRPKQLSKMQTMEGFIRKCYCIGVNTKNNCKYPNILMFAKWTDAALRVLADMRSNLRLEKYDHTTCVWCCDNLCHGECHTRGDLHSITENLETNDDKFVVVSWHFENVTWMATSPCSSKKQMRILYSSKRYQHHQLHYSVSLVFEQH